MQRRLWICLPDLRRGSRPLLLRMRRLLLLLLLLLLKVELWLVILRKVGQRRRLVRKNVTLWIGARTRIATHLRRRRVCRDVSDDSVMAYELGCAGDGLVCSARQPQNSRVETKQDARVAGMMVTQEPPRPRVHRIRRPRDRLARPFK